MFADPVCNDVRKALPTACRSRRQRARGRHLPLHGGTYPDPRRIEPVPFVGEIGMTNEARLAREAELCYATLAMSTDHDCWHEGHDEVTVDAIVAVMHANVARARKVIEHVVPILARGGACPHRDALKGAILSDLAQVDEGTRTRLDLLIGRYLPTTR
ncbi:MAG: hypothetical protein R3E96_15245 [Planctomycetota bacterium]